MKTKLLIMCISILLLSCNQKLYDGTHKRIPNQKVGH